MYFLAQDGQDLPPHASLHFSVASAASTLADLEQGAANAHAASGSSTRGGIAATDGPSFSRLAACTFTSLLLSCRAALPSGAVS